MAKGKAAFSLHKRLSSKKEELKKRLGKTAVKYVFYFQLRKPDGSYSSALSTGQSSRGAADEWARNYMKKGNIPTHRGFTFKHFASDWWIPGSQLTFTSLTLDIELLNALVLPLVLGFLLLIERVALPAEHRMKGAYRLLVWAIVLIVIAFGLFMGYDTIRQAVA